MQCLTDGSAMQWKGHGPVEEGEERWRKTNKAQRGECDSAEMTQTQVMAAKTGWIAMKFHTDIHVPFRIYFNNSGATMKPKTLVCQVPAKWMAFPTALAVLHVYMWIMLACWI